MKIDLLSIKNDPIKLTAVHALFWSIFIVYELAFLYFGFGELESPVVYISYYSLNISFFYCTAEVLNYVFAKQKVRYFKGIILFTGLLVAYCIFKFLIGFFIQTRHLPIIPYFQSFTKLWVSTFFRATYFAILSTFYWATTHISNFRRKAAEAEKLELIALKDKAELEIRLAEAQNAYLEHQLNPHLLFNSLGFIYNSVHKNSPKAAECVLLLSDIMSFSLNDKSEDGKVPLSGEVEQIRRLIDINRYRFDKSLAIEVKFSGCFENFRIIPLILFTLTENFFKHGNVLNAKFPALLSIAVDTGGLLVFQSSNLKRPGSESLPGRKIGLKNVRLRLDFAYQGNYSLTITEDEDFYQTSLILNL